MRLKIWRGETDSPAILSFMGSTALNKAGDRTQTQYLSWPILRLWGFALGRTTVTIARLDKPRIDRMEPL